MIVAMRKTGGVISTILMGVLFCSVSASGSTILFSTLGPHGEYDSSRGYMLGRLPFVGVKRVMAMPFTLDTGATVGDAVLALNTFAGDKNPESVYIESDSGGLPGGTITALSQAGDIPSGGGLVSFTCSVSCTLGAGSYWLVASKPSSQAWAWDYWDFAYQDIPGIVASNSAGSPTGPWFASYMGLGGFQIDAAASIPEPNSLLLLGSGLLVGTALVRRLKSLPSALRR